MLGRRGSRRPSARKESNLSLRFVATGHSGKSGFVKTLFKKVYRYLQNTCSVRERGIVIAVISIGTIARVSQTSAATLRLSVSCRSAAAI